VSKTNAIPLAIVVIKVVWIDGIQALTDASTEWKLVLKKATIRNPKRNTKHAVDNWRKLGANL
jgi:hypothetical protein